MVVDFDDGSPPRGTARTWMEKGGRKQVDISNYNGISVRNQGRINIGIRGSILVDRGCRESRLGYIRGGFCQLG
jgi:hypothetical protein